MRTISNNFRHSNSYSTHYILKLKDLNIEMTKLSGSKTIVMFYLFLGTKEVPAATITTIVSGGTYGHHTHYYCYRGDQNFQGVGGTELPMGMKYIC